MASACARFAGFGFLAIATVLAASSRGAEPARTDAGLNVPSLEELLSTPPTPLEDALRDVLVPPVVQLNDEAPAPFGARLVGLDQWSDDLASGDLGPAALVPAATASDVVPTPALDAQVRQMVQLWQQLSGRGADPEQSRIFADCVRRLMVDESATRSPVCPGETYPPVQASDPLADGVPLIQGIGQAATGVALSRGYPNRGYHWQADAFAQGICDGSACAAMQQFCEAVTPTESSMPTAAHVEITVLRASATQLDQVADELEHANLYERADAVRREAQKLRQEARQLIEGGDVQSRQTSRRHAARPHFTPPYGSPYPMPAVTWNGRYWVEHSMPPYAMPAPPTVYAPALAPPRPCAPSVNAYPGTVPHSAPRAVVPSRIVPQQPARYDEQAEPDSPEIQSPPSAPGPDQPFRVIPFRTPAPIRQTGQGAIPQPDDDDGAAAESEEVRTFRFFLSGGRG